MKEARQEKLSRKIGKWSVVAFFSLSLFYVVLDGLKKTTTVGSLFQILPTAAVDC